MPSCAHSNHFLACTSSLSSPSAIQNNQIEQHEEIRAMKKQALRGHYYSTFAEFRAAIDNCLSQIDQIHRPALKTLMTHEFQTFENVSFLAG